LILVAGCHQKATTSADPGNSQPQGGGNSSGNATQSAQDPAHGDIANATGRSSDSDVGDILPFPIDPSKVIAQATNQLQRTLLVQGRAGAVLDLNADQVCAKNLKSSGAPVCGEFDTIKSFRLLLTETVVGDQVLLYTTGDGYDTEARGVTIPVTLLGPPKTKSLAVTADGFLAGTESQGLLRFTFDGSKLALAGRYTTSDGLPGNDVSAVIDDGAGGYLLGTENGMAGLAFASGRLSVDPSRTALQGKAVYALAQRQGTLWVGSLDGLRRMPLVNGKPMIADAHSFNEYRTGFNSFGTVKALAIDPSGDAWVASADGRLVRAPLAENDQTRFWIVSASDLGCRSSSPSEISSVAADLSGNIWIASGSELRGLNIASVIPGTLNESQHSICYTSAMTEVGAEIGTLEFDASAGGLWIGTEAGLKFAATGSTDMRLSPKKVGDVHVEVAAVRKIERGVWIAAGTGFARATNPSTLTIYIADALPNTLTSDRISAISVGSDGGAWVGTRDGGLNRVALAPTNSGMTPSIERFRAAPGGIPDDHVRDVLAVGNVTWIATTDQGVSRISSDAGGNRSVVNSFPGEIFGEMVSDGAGGLFLSLDGENVIRHAVADASGNLSSAAELIVPGADDITALASDGSNGFWFSPGVGQGIRHAAFDAQGAVTYVTYDAASGFPDVLVKEMVQASGGGLWISSGDNRVIRMTAGAPGLATFTSYTLPSDSNGMPRRPLAIRPDPAGNLWIGTNDGLIRLIPRGVGAAYQVIRTEDGVPQEQIPALGLDPSGALWVGRALGGLVYFIPPPVGPVMAKIDLQPEPMPVVPVTPEF
jgi:ligand-binding sensor domain-containing protein